MTVVKNTNRKSKSESKNYVHAQTVIEGKEVDLLLTIAETKRAIERAKKNPEDIPANKPLTASCSTEKAPCCFWGKICRWFRNE